MPGPLIALIVGIGLVVFAGLDEHGVAVVAEVPRGLPVPYLPPLHHFGDLTPYALAIALLALLESISVARATQGDDRSTTTKSWWRSERPPSPVPSS